MLIHFLSLVIFSSSALLPVTAGNWDNPNCDGKQAIVHLFEWKWTDIALECERFLSSAGYCGVQVSPPNEHAWLVGDNFPWWQRYQPVSYKLESRSGNEAEFIDMVHRCNAVGVRIYVDAIINHMAALGRTGPGSGGSDFDGDAHDFPAVPFSREHFTPREECPSGDGFVNDYSDPYNVRNCYLVGLTDLYGRLDYVQEKIAEYFNHLIDIGVAGVRIDAAKHMWPADIVGVLQRLKPLNVDQGFPAGSQFFVYQEVIDRNDGAVTVNEYFDTGLVTEFRYSQKIAWGAADFGQLGGLVDFGWGMCPYEEAFVFVDNHDNQRGHGGSGDVVTHKDPEKYQYAVAYSLAQDYGFFRVMSSYFFESTDVGPPTNGNGDTMDVTINADGSCGNGWVCEHRWNVIAKMVGFRNAVAGTRIENYYNQNNQVAFSRGNKGFFAMTKEGMQGTFQTGMPEGDYCNIIDSCSTMVHVNGDGTAQISVSGYDHFLAICQGCTGDGFPTVDPTATTPTTESTTSGPTRPPITEGVARTIIFIEKQTQSGQDLFVRGGISHDVRPGCSEDAATSACAIDISTRSLGETEHYSKYNSWREEDNKLDWYGAERSQGTYNGQSAEGSPLAWTSSSSGSPGYQELNTFGDHYWMLEFDMDCGQSENGWFELKAYGTQGVGWEGDITPTTCRGISATPPYETTNHMAMCGFLNVFSFGTGSCLIQSLEQDGIPTTIFSSTTDSTGWGTASSEVPTSSPWWSTTPDTTESWTTYPTTTPPTTETWPPTTEWNRQEGWDNPHCNGKTVIVHLFEWKWTDIAAECERFLGPANYCGVQTSPPNEHVVLPTNGYPWWQRYQPVSYKLGSRSGTEEEFIDMVHRCNAVGVRIYIDAVVNHMAGLGRVGPGSDGSDFDSSAFDFPGVPYGPEHFTPRELCNSHDGNVNNYGDPYNVRNCFLVGLTDLYGANEYVRNQVAGYFNHMIDIGIAGIRIDAAKHMWPEDVKEILLRTKPLNVQQGFPPGSNMFVYQEVIDRNDGAVTVGEYFETGLVTEFRYTSKIAWGINDFGNLNGLYDPGWGMCPPDKAFVSVDNHDNQRGHGGAGDVITHKNPLLYKLAVAFTLAYDYGFTRIMSSYYFEGSDEGPPSDWDGNTLNVGIKEDGTCEFGWVCEHRWRSISRMPTFRNAVQGTTVNNFYNENNQVAFSRGNKGFFAMSKSGFMDGTFQTGMPAGTYCNIINDCETEVTVGGDGMAHVVINDPDEPVLAICQGCTGEWFPIVTSEPTPPTTPGPTVPPITSGIARTIVFIHKQTFDGQDLVIRGGISESRRPDCSEDTESDPCAIDITVTSLGETQHYAKYNAWRIGDTRLDWNGVEEEQGAYNGELPEGSPLAWTSSSSGNPGYQPENSFGDHYWMIEMEMDCGQTEDGWFEVKVFGTGGIGWEGDIAQGYCPGTGGNRNVPYASINHMGLCGFKNVFEFESERCRIDVLE